MVYTVSSSVVGGRRSRLFAALGCTSSIVPHMLAAMLGLSGIMQVGSAVFGVARVLLPESPAAKWDAQWAVELTSRALRHLAEHYIDWADLSVLELWEEKIDAAAKAEDQRAYREAVRGYLKAGLEAVEAAKKVLA